MSNVQNIPEVKASSELTSYLLPKLSSNKKTLVLDLDETLVHSQFQPFDVPSDIILKIELENELHDIHVMVRPGVSEFLKNMGKIYEIVIFTASVSKYADPLLDIIDKEKNCKFRLFREHCTPINTCYVKEIKKLGRELKNVIIVDNSPMSYALNPENGIPINTWFDDKSDRELYNISSILEFLSFVPDVRNYISQFIVNDEISYTNVINVFDKYNQMLTNEKISTSVNCENINNKTNNELIDENKNKNAKKIFNKNNSKTKFKNKENKENKENKNTLNNKIKKNITLNNLKQKENKKILPISKNSKSKSKQFNPKSIIANIDKNENNENMNPNILNILNQTTKNKTTKNINFNPSTIIASVSPISINTTLNNNNNIIPNTTKNNNINININQKVNNNILKHRKCDSFSGLRLPKKIYEKNLLLNVSKSNNNFLHSNSIIFNKKKKLLKNANSKSNFNGINSATNVHTTKNKNNKNIQLSMRLSHELGQELKKLEQSLEIDEKTQKKLSKSLTKDKITISLSQKSKINQNVYDTNTYSNKANYIYHKKHKSINTSYIPFPSTTKNIFHKNHIKPGFNLNNINNKYSKNSLNNKCKHRRYLSSSESFGLNALKGVYSTNTTHSNHSSIISSNNLINNAGNIFLNNLTNKNRQRNLQKKLEINIMKTERIKDKENINQNVLNKKKENKIPFNLNKKRNSAIDNNNNAFKKKIPVSNTYKNNLKMDININKKTGLHKKNMSFNPEISGLISLRPKSTKQFNHNKNGKKINFKIDINKENVINVNKNNNIENNNKKEIDKEITVVKI